MHGVQCTRGCWGPRRTLCGEEGRAAERLKSPRYKSQSAPPSPIRFSKKHTCTHRSYLIYTILQYTQGFLHKAQITASVSQTSKSKLKLVFGPLFWSWAPVQCTACTPLSVALIVLKPHLMSYMLLVTPTFYWRQKLVGYIVTIYCKVLKSKWSNNIFSLLWDDGMYTWHLKGNAVSILQHSMLKSALNSIHVFSSIKPRFHHSDFMNTLRRVVTFRFH